MHPKYIASQIQILTLAPLALDGPMCYRCHPLFYWRLRFNLSIKIALSTIHRIWYEIHLVES